MTQFHARAVAAALCLAACAAQAATVDWRQGSGNTGQHFTTAVGDVVFATGGPNTLTLGLRAVQRNVGTITPTGNVYAANAGPSSQANRAWWNFDIFAGLGSGGGALSALQSLTLGLETEGGSAPAAAFFDLLAPALRNIIDCHVIGCVNGNPVNADATVPDLNPLGNDGAASATADPTRFYNASQNATFAPWFSAFDMNRPGLYKFSLTGVDVQGNSVSTSMVVNVGNYVPEPGSLALAGLALLGVVALRRRRA